VKPDQFIREVDEAVRQERWLTLWKQYGAYAIGAAVAIVIGTAAGVGWREWQAHQREEEARRYATAVQLLQAEQPAEAAEAFRALAEDTGSGYSVLARLRAAGALGAAGEDAAGDQLLEGLATSDDVGRLYRDLGSLLTVQRQFAGSDPENLAARLERLAEGDGPWRYSALELEALARMRAGDHAAAREILTELVRDPAAPPALGRRATELLALLGGPVDDAEAGATGAGAGG